MSPAVNLALEDVPFAILEVVKARILANRRRLGAGQDQQKPPPSLKPRPQLRKFGASSKNYRRPEPAATGGGGKGVGLWKTSPTGIQNTNPNYDGWFGVRFKAAQNFTITYLGGFDNLENGLQVSYPIRVWREIVDEPPEIIEDTQLDQGDMGPLAGGFRFTKVEPIKIFKDDIISIVIRYIDSDVSLQQEDRYQYYLGSSTEEVVKSNPDLVSEIRLTETINVDEYPEYDSSSDVVVAVNVNFAIGLPGDAIPDWAQADDADLTP